MADNITIKDGSGANVVMATDDRGGVNWNKIAGYDEVFDKLMVGTARDKLRDEFFTFDTTNVWEVIATGSGQTITTAGAANGSRYLKIATGVTTSSETIIQSRDSFKLPVKLAFALSMSQRIANQEVFVELVGVNSSGVVETDATFASANLNNASNAASFKFDAVTAANAVYITRGFATSELASASTAFTGSTTVATGTTPNFIAASIYEINADMEEVVWNTRAIDSLAAVQLAVKRTQNLPDPGKDYKVRIRIRNLGTAPASTTDVRLHFIRVLDTTRFTVDFARHMGRTADIADSLPVAVTNAHTVAVSNIAAIAAGATAIGDVGVQYRATAAGAASRSHLVAAATTNPTIVKNAAGRLIGWCLSNTTASWRYVKLHNIATAPTAGTGVVQTIGIPPNATVTFEADGGIAFATGIGLTTVTGSADADATAVAAGDIVGDLFFA